MATVRRKDITLEEERDTIPDPDRFGYVVTTLQWTAELRGDDSEGRHVILRREAPHAGEALALLEEALEKEGWTLR